MAIDRSFIERNRAATERIRAMAQLTVDMMQTPVGEHWTVAIVLAHLAFWDRRVLAFLDQTEREHRPVTQEIDIVVNDISLPLWAAIPPLEAGRIALESAEALDRRLENFPPDLLEEIYAQRKRWVERSLHRDEHLDEADAALRRWALR